MFLSIYFFVLVYVLCSVVSLVDDMFVSGID